MKASIQTVKGARDFYPEEMAVRSWLYRKIREVSESFGYQEYDGPFLERIELYAAKSSDELVKEQAFTFQDRGGDYITLRPELTPSLARMIVQKQHELAYPLRWWSFGPFWRYERPQRGRSREFFQWNIDLIGVNTPEADAELVAVCAVFFRSMGIQPDQVQILVNHRQLIRQELDGLGVADHLKQDVYHLIDRRDKMQPQTWEANALELGLSEQQLDGLKVMLADPDLYKRMPDFERFFAAIEAMGVSEYVRYAPHIIRGLDYYTGIVFEAHDIQGGRAVLGGGHYDNLVSAVGGEPLPGIGFAMGDMMSTIVLEKYGCIPSDLTNPSDQVLVTVFDESFLLKSYQLAAELRSAGIKALVYPETAKLQKQMKFADRKGIRYVIICGPDEDANGQVTVKDLAGRTQQTLEKGLAAEMLLQNLAK
jgi:histidyl-tRNA synthetase